MYRYKNSVEVLFGAGRLKEIADIMAERQLDRAMIVADPFSVQSGLAQRVQEYGSGRIIGIASDVEPNPTCDNVDACTKKARELGAKAIIALGGGSAIDCAKSTAAAVAMDCTGMELLRGKKITEALPIIAIPTTAGTGSEVGWGAVLSNHETNEKIAIFGNPLFPQVALVDPELTYTVPPKVTASTGLDVIAHSLDAMCSVKHNPVSDALAVSAAKLAFENLEKAYLDGNDVKARENMAIASNTAGYAFSNTGTTASHACSYLLTAKYHIPHGEACVFTLDAWLRKAVSKRPELETLAQMMGFSSIDAVADRINELKALTGMRTTLTQAGIPTDDAAIQELVESAAASSNMTNDVNHPTLDEIREVFESRR
jgi:alcohol dehydrogenase